VYRCVQEALTNALKHAPGAMTTVVARNEAGRIQIDVDNGPPTEPDALRSQSGSTEGGRGLAGMQERVAAVGGAFAAGPTPEGGFQVRLSLPVAARSK